jgi:hypothetical protein
MLLCLSFFVCLVACSNGQNKNTDTASDFSNEENLTLQSENNCKHEKGYTKTKIKEATCITKEMIEFTCELCNDSYVDTYEFGDHNYVSNKCIYCDSIKEPIIVLPDLPVTVNIDSYWPQLEIYKITYEMRGNDITFNCEAKVENQRDFNAAFYLVIQDAEGLFIGQELGFGGHVPQNSKFKCEVTFSDIEYSNKYIVSVVDYNN